jgi:AcrR family transcriptional regulator
MNRDVSTRTYRQTRRAESAAATRGRILEAARASLAGRPLRPLNVGEVAEHAGVARSTVYEIFGSREGLHVALAEDVLERGGFARLRREFRRRDALEALEGSLHAWARLGVGELAVGGALLSLGAIDPDAAAAVARFEAGRIDGMRSLARRLRAQGYLPPEVSEAEAVDLLWVVTHHATLRALVEERGLGRRSVALRLIAMARGSLRIPGGTSSP